MWLSRNENLSKFVVVRPGWFVDAIRRLLTNDEDQQRGSGDTPTNEINVNEDEENSEDAVTVKIQSKLAKLKTELNKQGPNQQLL